MPNKRVRNPEFCLYCGRKPISRGLCTNHYQRWRNHLPMEAPIKTLHGGSEFPEYFVWKTMKARCLRPTSRTYKHYGGRGISICDRWLNDFGAFIADVGRRPSERHSIDRIDVNGNYEPGNVRWVTRDVQVKNRRKIGDLQQEVQQLRFRVKELESLLACKAD